MMTNADAIELVKSYVGCSLKKRANELGELVSCGVDDPKRVVGIKTNCGMVARGIFKKIGINHDVINKPYVLQQAIADLVEIGNDLGIIEKYTKSTKLHALSLLMYNTKGKNDNHVEFLLSDPNKNLVALHAGGGGTDNLVSSGSSLITWSIGRPLTTVWHVHKLLERVEN